MSKIQTVGILGAGQMGLGIAQVTSRAGLKTTLVKMTPGSVDGARKKIETSFSKEVEKGRMKAEQQTLALESLTTTTDFNQLAGCDLIIESIVEDLATKNEAFTRLDGLCGANTIFASNTSTLSITAMAVATKRRDRFIGLHFFNPAPVMKLVEVAGTIGTSAEVLDAAVALCTTLGKTPVRVPDATGFVVNRLLVPYMVDGMKIWQEGTGSIADIDTAMQNGAGHPMGPFALADYIGLDVVLHMASLLYDEYKEPRLAPPPILRRLVMSGQLGKKNGKGFYDYSAQPLKPNSALSR